MDYIQLFEMGGTTLLLIDVQRDFHPGGSLAIPTADADAERIVQLLEKSINNPIHPKIDRVIATLDSHHKLHIAHPCFWISGADGITHPRPFTIISHQDVLEGKWKPRSDLHIDQKTLLHKDFAPSSLLSSCVNQEFFDITKYCIEYTRLLEDKGRFQLCIWPEHCLIGSEGHAMHSNVRLALETWCDTFGKSIEWIMKGQNLLTEMYSCLAAEVPISIETSWNQSLLQNLQSEDRIWIVGQAMSHCVNYTVRDLLNHMLPEERHKVYVLKDCMSPVPGFEKESQDFLSFVSASGANICVSTDLK